MSAKNKWFIYLIDTDCAIREVNWKILEARLRRFQYHQIQQSINCIQGIVAGNRKWSENGRYLNSKRDLVVPFINLHRTLGLLGEYRSESAK